MKKLTKLFLMTIVLLIIPMTAYASYGPTTDERIATFFPSLILTIMIQPMPMLVYRYYIVKEPISPKKAKKIITIYGLVFAFINGYFVGSYGYLPVVFWSAILSYFLTKGYKDDVENDLNQAIENSSLQTSQEKTSSQTDDR